MKLYPPPIIKEAKEIHLKYISQTLEQICLSSQCIPPNLSAKWLLCTALTCNANVGVNDLEKINDLDSKRLKV